MIIREREKIGMEAKTRAAVLAACLFVLLLSGQPPQVSGSSKYCECFRQCYKHCRDGDQQPRPVCKVRCGAQCIVHSEVSAASALAGGGSSCRELCLASVGCSTDVTATGGDGKNLRNSWTLDQAGLVTI